MDLCLFLHSKDVGMEKEPVGCARQRKIIFCDYFQGSGIGDKEELGVKEWGKGHRDSLFQLTFY